MKTLQGNNETFAVKSGGHNPNKNFASVKDGPLISTASLNEVLFDNVAQTVRVGPGNRWEDVIDALEGTGMTVVGGRIGEVGVGGYVVGGKYYVHFHIRVLGNDLEVIRDELTDTHKQQVV